jgi:hypothetical protein
MDLRYILGEKGRVAFYDTTACVQPLIQAARQRKCLHAELALNSCVVTCNVVQEIAAITYSPIAYGLCRSALELAAGTVYLAQHPELTEDFLNYGAWLHCEIGKSSNPPTFPPLPNQTELEGHFKAKSGRGFPTWHGMTQQELIQNMFDGGRVVKNSTSAFLHGDALMSVAAVAFSPDSGWQPALFRPMPLDVRAPIETAIVICSELLFAMNAILQLGCEEVVKRLQDNMVTLGLPGFQ